MIPKGPGPQCGGWREGLVDGIFLEGLISRVNRGWSLTRAHTTPPPPQSGCREGHSDHPRAQSQSDCLVVCKSETHGSSVRSMGTSRPRVCILERGTCPYCFHCLNRKGVPWRKDSALGKCMKTLETDFSSSLIL